MLNQFSRTQLLLGEDGMRRLSEARVAVFGAGAVGGYAVEALVRSGIGTVDIFDDGVITESNQSRQIAAAVSDTGRLKAETVSARALLINPNVKMNVFTFRYSPEVDLSVYDYILDASCCAKSAAELACAAHSCGVRIISVMDLKSRKEPSMLAVADINKIPQNKTTDKLRYDLRQCGVKKLMTVYSKEKPSETGGTAVFVPAAAGLIAAGEIVKDLSKGDRV